MIRLPREHWWEISEVLYDDSTGPIDPPDMSVVAVHQDWIELHFPSDAEETFFRLRWLT